VRPATEAIGLGAQDRDAGLAHVSVSNVHLGTACAEHGILKLVRHIVGIKAVEAKCLGCGDTFIWLFLATLVLVIPIATASYFIVEKPALRLKNSFTWFNRSTTAILHDDSPSNDPSS